MNTWPGLVFLLSSCPAALVSCCPVVLCHAEIPRSHVSALSNLTFSITLHIGPGAFVTTAASSDPSHPSRTDNSFFFHLFLFQFFFFVIFTYFL